ncbi:ABC transporter permease [Candidatus Omnitrophota bacterium]
MEIFDRRYMNLTKEFTIAWFKLRDQRSILGFLWSFLNPLIMASILYFLFRSRMGLEKERTYFLYILIGMISWNFFSISVQIGLAALLKRPGMVKNVIFPKEILVFSSICLFVIQHIFEIAVVFLFLAFARVGFSAHLLLLPVVILLEGFIIAGIALFLSCVCIYARDIVHIWTVFVRMGFFLVPVFYKTSALSPRFRWIVAINPMTQIMNFYRDILLYHRLPDTGAFLLVLLFSSVLLILGYRFFKVYEFRIAERV